MPRGCRQAYCVKRLIRSPKTKPTSSPTLCALCRKNGRWSDCDLEEQNQMVFGKHSLQGYESNRWNAHGVRVENIPSNHSIGPPREDWKNTDRYTVWAWELQRKDHLLVDVQRHCMGCNRKQRTMWTQFTGSCGIGSQIPWRSLVFLGAWIRRKVARNLHWQTRWIMGSNGRTNDGKILWIRSSDMSCLQCFWERRITKQRRRQEVNTLQW